MWKSAHSKPFFSLALCMSMYSMAGCSNSPDNPPRKNGIILEKRYYSGSGTYYIFHDDTVDVYTKVMWPGGFGGKAVIIRTSQGDRGIWYGIEDGDLWTIVSGQDKIPSSIQPTKKDSSATDIKYFYKASDIASITVAKYQEDYETLKAAPVKYEATSVLVDWSSCTKDTACADLGNTSENEVFNIESSGLILRSVNTDIKLQYTP